jgi:hypothetical protein|nr:MAG TPA: short tail fiber protein [Caudoviricetes sp.]
MPHQIETLKKIEYVDLQQFVEQINYNFAVLENSPFFKGIPGKKGQRGEVGIKGTRGIKFYFVDYNRFNQEYPNEINSSQLIDLEFINRKLALGNVNSTDKQKLLNALNTVDFVIGDVIVLTNTKLLSFNGVEFEDTNIAFDSNYGNNKDIREIIKEYVDTFILNNDKIKSIKNIFHSYLTHAKNYQDVSNTLITNSITSKSIYEPYIKGNKKGIEVLTHKYIGYSHDILSNDEQKSTVILGSVNKYIKILQNTFGTDLNKTLISDYSPGVGNEPTMVILQNDLNSGLMIGYRDSLNFKSFGRIFRNYDNEFIIESNVGPNSDEKGTLKLHNEYLNWDKNAKFERNVEVSHDLFVGLNIDSKLIRTGEFTPDKKSYELYLGPKDKKTDSKTVNTAFIEQYTHYIENVLVTDNNGIVLKTYSLEKGGYDIKENEPFNPISTSVSSENKLVTSNYLGLITKKVNSLINKVSQDYWSKKDFKTGVISKLTLSEQLQVGNNLIKSNEVNLGSNTIINQNLTLNSFKNNVLVTDNTGKIVNTYSLENSDISTTELELFNQINSNGNISSENKILSSKYFNYLTSKINKLINKIKSDYYTKEDWKTPTLPTSPKSINLSDVNIILGGNTRFYFNGLFNFNKDNAIFDKPVILNNYLFLKANNEGILYLNSEKKVISYPLLSNNLTDESGDTNSQVIHDSGIPSISLINSLIRKINNVINHFKNNHFSKNDWINGNITDWVKPKMMEILDIFKWSKNNQKVELNENNIIIRPKGNNSGFLKVDTNGVVSVGNLSAPQFPIGTVISWAGDNFLQGKLSHMEDKDSIPAGWYVCDGSNVEINGKMWTTPDLRNRFIMGDDLRSEDFDEYNFFPYTVSSYNNENFVKIKWNQLPPHSHKMEIVDWEHSHKYKDTFFAESASYANGREYDHASGGLGSNGGIDWDNVCIYVERESEKIRKTDGYKGPQIKNRVGGDVFDITYSSEFPHFTQNGNHMTSIAQQLEFDKRPAYCTLIYLIYFGE